MVTNSNELFSFGDLLKAFRKRQHLTQQQLAEALGMHRQAVIRWEQGDFLPASKPLVLELSRHLHLDAQETHRLLEASLTALSLHWYVPLPRNPFFTGREEILTLLHTHLRAEQEVAFTQSFALHGLGGVGKTQIALEYAHRHARDYHAIFWIGAETAESIVASLLHIAEVLQLPERDDKDQQRVVAAVQRWLHMQSQWLLIWDNVEDLALLQRFLPAAHTGTILLTTRSQAVGMVAQSINLLPMEREEGTLFLLRRAKVLEADATHQHVQQLAVNQPDEYAAAENLVEVMGELPLALDQAGAYIEEVQCGLSTYLELFRTRRASLLLRRGAEVRDHPESVSTTLVLSIAATVEHHPAVRDLLRICALLQPEAIPEELFRQGAEHFGALLQTVGRDEQEWNRLVAVAGSYSLLHRQAEERTLSIHRLVQAILLDTMTEGEQEQWLQRAVEALDVVFPEVMQASAYAAWEQCERLLPHALLCLQRVGTVEETLTLASLAYKVARYLCERGRYADAVRLLQRALHVREQALGQDHLSVAQTLNGLAGIYFYQGKYAEAESLYLRTLHIWEQALSPDHPQVAQALNGLAGFYWSQGKYTEVEPLLQRALHISEQALGANDFNVARSLNNLAKLYLYQGKYMETEPLLQRALHISEQVLGSDHPQVAYSLNNLAELYTEQARYAEAEPLHQRALDLREQILGPDHPQVAYSLNNLAELYTEQARYAEAEPPYQRVLRILENAMGSEHPDAAPALYGLANLYREQGKYAEAERLYQRALHIREQSLNSDHPLVAKPLNGLANLLREQGKYTEAVLLFQRALSIRERHLGQHHPETAQTLHDLAVLHQEQHNVSEALLLAQRALEIRSQFLGDVHPKTGATRALCAQLIRAQSWIETKKSSG